MKQRVNIQYSIDIEDLEPEVGRLMEAIETKVQNLHANTKFSSDVLSLSTLTTIEDLRMELANIDFMLADVTKIVNAYVSYRLQQAAAAAETPDASQHPAQQNQEHEIPENILANQSDLLRAMENLRSAHGTMTESDDRPAQT
jgi:hypothetical protein